jgi:twitching motility protein PilT
MTQIGRLLRFACEQAASDLHVSAGERPAIRVNGDLHWVDLDPLSPDDAHRLIFDVMSDSQRKTFQEHLECDFAYRLDDSARFRVNAFVQSRGEGAVFRAIPTQIPKIANLGLPPVIRTFCDEPKGLVLVTGPTGSGKSTTLAAMIDYLNETMPGHILTLEDPIEFVHTSKRSLVNQREVHAQTRSFGTALRSALREDPDVILVGELRDPETIQLALTAAETGHLVFGTLHTQSAAKTVDRIIDSFPAEQQPQVRAMFAESLVGVVTQTLVKRMGGGRVAALEILVGTPALRNVIREGKTHQVQSLLQVGTKSGMQTLEAALADLVAKRLVALEEARSKLPSSELLASMAQGGVR